MVGGLVVVGCASPGPPRAPSLHLPQPVKGLTAERHGDAVVVRFATPQRTMLRVNDVLRPFVPHGVSLADELIAERKREAELEAREAKDG